MSGAADAGAAVGETPVQYYENDGPVTAPSGSLHDEAGQAAGGAEDHAAHGGDDLSEYETGPAQVEADQGVPPAPGSSSSADDLDTDEQAPALRVTFHDQDFVAFPAMHVDGTPAFHLPDGSVKTAPELQMSESVFWEPLESLFVALRVREALGEFLDEDTALVLTFPMLELVLQEDDMYGREVSLHDVLRLHLGLGHKATMHVKVTEGPRFISRYNHLAMLINAAADEEDEEDEAAAFLGEEDASEAAEEEGQQAEDEGGEDGEHVGPDSDPAADATAEQGMGRDADAGGGSAGQGDEAGQSDDAVAASTKEVQGGGDEDVETGKAGAEEVDDDETGKAGAMEAEEDEAADAGAGGADIDDEEIDSDEADGDGDADANEADADEAEADEADADEADADEADADEADADEADADEADADEADADEADADEAEADEADADEADADEADADGADADDANTDARNAAENDTIDAGAVDADEADAGAGADTAQQKNMAEAAQPETAAAPDDTHNAAFIGEDDHLPAVNYDEQDVGEYEAEDTAPPADPSESSSTARPHGKRGAEPDAPGLDGQGDAKRPKA